ncbi:hypothetical protein EDF66_10785 [Sphingobacterium sp. JUb20]|nr:hypothetical protein [Sphingobacterium sp. JUb21]TCR05190.1 hypothetical protein EDF66_10785 [Sphingobacterium sp. JUb20]
MLRSNSHIDSIKGANVTCAPFMESAASEFKFFLKESNNYNQWKDSVYLFV